LYNTLIEIVFNGKYMFNSTNRKIDFLEAE
jgi:hypothetical protein